MIVCIPHAKVGYRQAIFSQRTPASKEVRGFLLAAVVLSLPVTFTPLATCTAVRRAIRHRAWRAGSGTGCVRLALPLAWARGAARGRADTAHDRSRGSDLPHCVPRAVKSWT